MSWASLFAALLKLLVYVSTKLTDEQLKQEGEKRLAAEQLEEIHARLKAAVAARNESNTSGLHESDGHRRD